MDKLKEKNKKEDFPDLDQKNYDEYIEVFAYFDKDESGELDKDELGTCMRAKGFLVTDEEIKEIMGCIDTDNNQRIDFKEFVDFMEKQKKEHVHGDGAASELKKAFQTIDKDNKGFLTLEELKQYIMPFVDANEQESISDLIQAMDKNGDGKIDIEEFIAIWE